MYLSIITPPLYDIIHSQNDCYSKMNSNLMISVTKLSLVNLLLIIIKFSFICEGQPCRVRIINSKWHLFHLCHRRSSSWQSAVPTETTKLALWQLSVFRANMKVIISQYGVHTQWINTDYRFFSIILSEILHNLRCQQWRQSWHYDNSRFSVLIWK